MHKVWTKIIATISLSGGVMAAAISLGAWSNNHSADFIKNPISFKPTIDQEAVSKLPANIQNKTETESFIKRCSGLPNSPIINNLTFNGKRVYVGIIGEGLYYSPDPSKNLFTKAIGLDKEVDIANVTVNNNYVYAGTFNRGLYVSRTWGANFSLASSIPADAYIKTIAINKNYVYVVTNSTPSGSGNGLYWSDDYGKSFQQATGTGTGDIPDNADINNVTVNNNHVYVGTDGNGLYISSDGEKFSLNSDIPDDADIKNITIHSNHMYVGTSNHGLWIGSNSGSNRTNGTFSHFTQPPSLSKHVYTITNVSFHNNQVYVGTANYSLYVSNDGGTTFSRAPGIYPGAGIRNVSFHNNQVYVETETRLLGYSLYVSYDGGTTFNPVLDIPAGTVINKVITVDNQVYVGTWRHGLYISTDDGKTFHKEPSIRTNTEVNTMIGTINHTVYVGTDDGLFFGVNGGQAFIKAPLIYSTAEKKVGSVAINNNQIYITILNGGGLYYFSKPVIWESVPYYVINDSGMDWWVYAHPQTISLPLDFISTAKIDGQIKQPGATGINLDDGDHTITVTLNKQNKQYAPLFGGVADTGEIIYHIRVDGREVVPTTTDSNTILLTGLSSTKGGTKGVPIIQTKIKAVQQPQSALNLNITNKMIDYSKSYYVAGTVTDNTFHANAGESQPLAPLTTIKKDGIYHLVLTDYLGNTYEAYLELGDCGWILNDSNTTFNDDLLNQLSKKLNVNGPKQFTNWEAEAKFSGWLNGYRSYIRGEFNKLVVADGKGFDIAAPNDWTDYSTQLIYTESLLPDYTKALKTQQLANYVTTTATNQLNFGIAQLPSGLKVVPPKNISDKFTLDEYTNWISTYDEYINKNYYQWAQKAVVEASLGYVSSNEIAQFIHDSYKDNNSTGINYFKSQFLKSITWESGLKPVKEEFDKHIDFNRETDWISSKVETKFHVTEKLSEDIKVARKVAGLTSDKAYNAVMNYKKASAPKNKSEVDDFNQSGKTFAEWLKQAKADYDAHANNTNQAKIIGMAVGIAIAGVIVLAVAGWIFYTRYGKKSKLTSYKKSAGKNK